MYTRYTPNTPTKHPPHTPHVYASKYTPLHDRYLFIVLVVGFGLVQVLYLNKGLAEYDAVLFMPIYLACLVVFSTVSGMMYVNPHKTHIVWSCYTL